MKAEDFTVVALSNWSYRLIALNWALNMERLNIQNYLIYCLDEHTYKFLKKNNIKCETFYVTEEVKLSRRTTFIVYWASFLRQKQRPDAVFEAKLILYKRVLDVHENIIFSDIDAIWLKDPFPLLLRELENYEMLFSMEGDEIDNLPGVKENLGFIICTGWFAWKKSIAVQNYINGLYYYYITTKKNGKLIDSDQEISNYYLLENTYEEVDALENGDYSVISRDTKIKVLSNKIINRSYTNKNDVYICHPFIAPPLSPKSLLLNKNLWSVPWLTTFRNINFIGSFIFLFLRVPFFGNMLQMRTPQIEHTYHKFTKPAYYTIQKIISFFK